MKRLILALLTLTACTQNKELPLSSEALVFTHVNIVDVRNGNVIEDQLVVIDSGKIKFIFPEGSTIPENTQLIDATGKYLMPGLSEMHAHIPHPDAGQDYLDNTLFLYLSNGITTVRGMLGHPAHLELREKALKNEILSPRIFTSSPSLNGNTVQSIEEAKSKVESYAEAGYDFLKLHPGLKLEVFNEIAKTSNKIGIPFAGHVSVDVGIRNALQSDYATIDHVDGYLEGLVPPDAGVNPEENGFFGFNFTDLADENYMSELVDMTREHRVWVVPTQALFDRWFSPDKTETFATQPEMKYIPADMLRRWVESKNNLNDDESYSAEKWERFNGIRHKLIYELNKNGYGLLLGSDAPQVFNVPGFSIHHELQGMLDAGLSIAEAIKIGTLNPAVYLEMEGEFGEIVEGASADFILLEKNPLEDLNNLKNPSGVMVRGHWLSREDIDQRLNEIEAQYQNQ